MPDWSYRTLLRPLLFLMPPKRARDFTFTAMGALSRLPLGPQLIDLLGHMRPSTALKLQAFGVEWPSVVGVGAGLDQQGIALAALSRFGVGFLEIGPLTLEPLTSSQPIQRLPELQTISYPDLPENIGAEAMALRLKATGYLSVPLGARIAHQPGVSSSEAAMERAQIMNRLGSYVTYFVLDTRWGTADLWKSEEWTAHLAMLRQTLTGIARERPVLLSIAPDLPISVVKKLVEPALEFGIAGLVVAGGVATEDGRRLTGLPTQTQSRRMVLHLRQTYGEAITIIGSGGVEEPADALHLIDAGASLVQIHSGFVYSGPALPKRINEALLHRAAASSVSLPWAWRDLIKTGWFWTFLLGLGMIIGGLLAFFVAATSVILPYDERFVGLSAADIEHVNPHLLMFMMHDRVTLAGTMISIGVLYSQLAWNGMRCGAHWAWKTVLVSGTVGFSSFFLCLGFGYFDPLHALVTVLLFPFFLLGMRFARHDPMSVRAADLQNDRIWQRALWGQLLFVAIGFGLTLAGISIAAIGVTHVFVPQDLMFLHSDAATISAVNPHLVPLIAHDRAGFGGALVSDGIAVLLLSLWGIRRGARWVWWTLLVAGAPGFIAGIGVHVMIGYLNLIHLAPVAVAFVFYALGLALLFGFLCSKPRLG